MDEGIKNLRPVIDADFSAKIKKLQEQINVITKAQKENKVKSTKMPFQDSQIIKNLSQQEYLNKLIE